MSDFVFEYFFFSLFLIYTFINICTCNFGTDIGERYKMRNTFDLLY